MVAGEEEEPRGRKNETESMPNKKRAARDQTFDRFEQHMVRGEIAPAQQIAASLIREYPNFARGWLAAARAAVRLDDLEKAIMHLTKASRLDPDDPTINAHAAMIFTHAGISGKGRGHAEAALRSGNDDPQLYALAGAALNMNGDLSGARQSFERALELKPDHPEYLYQLAAIEKFYGELDAAEEHLEEAIAINPAYGRAHYHLATLRRYIPDTAHIERLTALLDRPLPGWKDEVTVRYALGKELNDLGDYAAAFKSFAAGAKQQRKNTSYSLAAELGKIDRIIELHSASSLSEGQGGTSEASPIFILGLPRTGSTLIERILDSHAAVISKGELNVFSMALDQLVSALPESEKDADAVEAYLQVDYAKLGLDYLKRAGERAPEADRFIDKMPGNSEYIGLIIRALPNARIIYLDRDPRDTAIANYTTFYNTAYPWSCDLGETVDYLIAHRRLMDHWRREFPGRILSLAYEDIVADQEASTRRLLEYCGLPWDDNCLRFFENKSAATSASSTQVREPIYSSSIGRWKNFEPYLGSVLDRLGKVGNDAVDGADK